MQNSVFDQVDFGPLNEFLGDDNVTDISFSNGGQVWLKTLNDGVYKVERPEINDALMEKVAFQCANTMGKTFNMAHPFLDSESAELRMNFVHDSIATNGIACVIRKTPAKIRLNKDKLLSEDYMTEKLHDFLEDCVHGHCNIIVSGETGSGKTELVKYLASKTYENEKIISIEDTLELHLDRIYPNRDIVAMKTNNIASYSDVLVTCMRQNPIWILLSEVRSAEAVLAVRNSISSGHHILSTIHADKASSIPMRMYSLLESSQDTEQFLSSVHRYVQIGIYVKGYFSKKLNRFQREIIEVCEFYVDDDNVARSNTLYKKTLEGKVTMNNPTKHLLDYLSIGNVFLPEDTFGLNGDNTDASSDTGNYTKTQEVNDMLNSSNDQTIEDQPKEPAPVETIETNETLDLNTEIVQPVIENETAPVENINTEVVNTPEPVIESIQPEVNINEVNNQEVEPIIDTQPTEQIAEQTEPIAVTNVEPIIEDIQPIIEPTIVVENTTTVEPINNEDNSSNGDNPVIQTETPVIDMVNAPNIITPEQLINGTNNASAETTGADTSVVPPLEPMQDMEVL